MEAPYSNPLPTLIVHKRKPSAFNGLRKLFLIFFGLVGLLVSIALFFTIIGIPFAILMWIGSAGFIAMAGDSYQVSCPNCKKKMIVRKNQEDFKCKRCSQPTIIEWKEYQN